MRDDFDFSEWLRSANSEDITFLLADALKQRVETPHMWVMNPRRMKVFEEAIEALRGLVRDDEVQALVIEPECDNVTGNAYVSIIVDGFYLCAELDDFENLRKLLSVVDNLTIDPVDENSINLAFCVSGMWEYQAIPEHSSHGDVGGDNVISFPNGGGDE